MISKRDIVTRKKDKKNFIASAPKSSDMERTKTMFGGLFTGKSYFYFLGVKKNKKKWYRPWDKWEKTGEIWDCYDGDEFDIGVVD